MTKFFGKILIVFMAGVQAHAWAQTARFESIKQLSGVNGFGAYHGVAVGDYDGDGDEDLYFSCQNASNLLYENLGNGQFIDVTAAAGVKTSRLGFSAVWGDVDNDGDLDLFVGMWFEGNHLFLNNGDKTFRDVTRQAGLALSANTVHALLADVDNDGFLDLYLTITDDGNRLYHNNGNGTFIDVTLASGAGYKGRAMGAGFFDYDKDGDVDLYLVHDHGEANHLFQNDGAGHFINVAARAGVNFAGEGMGVDFGDYNNDGWLDLYVTNMNGNLLYLNNKNGTFTDVTKATDVANGGMSWGCNFFDCDNDGWLDIFVANQSHFWQMQQIFPNALYRNKGDGTFVNVAAPAGLATTLDSFGSAALDFDNDGWLDIVVADNAAANEFFKNMGGTNRWLNIQLEGTKSNRSAVGARVEAFAENWRRVDEVRAGSSYNSQNSLTLEFGLGQREKVDSLLIYWPSGLKEKYNAIAVNQKIKIVEQQGIVTGVNRPEKPRDLPQGFVLLPNYPNPLWASAHGRPSFNPATTIRYALPEPGTITLKVFDVLGHQVENISFGLQQPGNHEMHFAPTHLSSGVYLYRLEMTAAVSGQIRSTKYGKMMFVK